MKQHRTRPLAGLPGIVLGLWLGPALALGVADPALPGYEADAQMEAALSSQGDPALKGLMDAFFEAYAQHQPRVGKGRWRHEAQAQAIGALMFELAEMAPLTREFTSAETAPYAHQFAGDMMKAPLMIRLATSRTQPAFVAVNKRPGAPLPAATQDFLAFALSLQGQEVVARDRVFSPLDRASADAERAKLSGYVAQLDPGLPLFEPGAGISGEIRSVGSDGMKSLMDRWMRELHALQPGIRPGARWEHLGTLNGFHALLVDETDIAPMGRELWTSELAAYRASGHGAAAPLEFRVARGGFNTPQRTTAQAIFVHQDNPLTGITLAQAAAVFGEPASITRWGQLGLTGAWADRPIHVFMPPQTAPNATSMQLMVLKGGAWKTSARQGSIAEAARAIAADAAAIGFGGFEEGGPGLKPLAVARDAAGPFIEGDASSASSGRYPLTRYLYIRLHAPAGGRIEPPIREFLRYVLSRQGQAPILSSGYFPLTAAEVAEERAKLE